MRRILVLVLMVGLGLAAFASGQPEPVDGDPVVIGIWADDRELAGEHPLTGALLFEEVLFGDWPHPIELRHYPVGDGAQMSVQLDLAAGDPPDIYQDYMGRVNHYAHAQYAVDLSNLVDTDLWDPSFLAMTTKDGGVWALPMTAWFMPMVVNRTIMEEIGMFDVIEDRSWTLAEFEEASRRVRELERETYGFVMFAGGGIAGDYWNLALLPSFGASLYRDNQIVIGEPEGRRALRWYQNYVNEGLAPPGAAALGFRERLDLWAQHRLLALSAPHQHSGVGRETYEAGASPVPFEGWVMGFPLAPGVGRAPMAVGPDAAMMFRKGEARPAVVDALMRLVGPYSQGVSVAYDGRIPALKEVEHLDGPAWEVETFEVGLDLLREHGAWDIGLGLTEYSRIRVLVPELFQAIYTGADVDEAVDAFIAEANEILGQ